MLRIYTNKGFESMFIQNLLLYFLTSLYND